MSPQTLLRLCVILCATFALAACATAAGEPKVRIIEKAVPTPVPCVTDKTPRPGAYPDTDGALKSAPSAAARYALIAAGRLLKNQRLAETEPVIAACRKIPPP